MARKLTPEEVEALGLEAPEPQSQRVDIDLRAPPPPTEAPTSDPDRRVAGGRSEASLLTTPVATPSNPLERYALAAGTGTLPLTVASDVFGFAPESALRLYGQGASRGFLDEGVGVVESAITDATYEEARDGERRLLASAREDMGPVGSLVAEGAGGMVGPRVKGGWGKQAAQSGLEGAIGGAGAAETLAEVPAMMTAGGTIGAGAGVLGSLLSDAGAAGLERLREFASGRVADAGAKATDMAAKKVAAEVASAKGALGAATQDANRAVENLLRLEQTGALTADQAGLLATLRQNGILPALEQKLADSMLEKVPGAASKVDLSRAAYEGLANNQGEAVAQGAEDLLSGAEAKRQVMERVNRYAPTVVGALGGGAAGGAAGFLLGGSPTEALIGGLAGAGIRPALRAGQRMLAHPAVQSRVFSPIERLAGVATGVMGEAGPVMASAARAAVDAGGIQSTHEWMQGALAQNPEALGPYAQTLAQAQQDGRLASVHYVLEQTDPEYRATLEAARKGL